jgi:hypothetical protein
LQTNSVSTIYQTLPEISREREFGRPTPLFSAFYGFGIEIAPPARRMPNPKCCIFNDLAQYQRPAV